MSTTSLRDSLLPDFDQEMAATRKVLERVPDASLDWRPHEKSFDMAGLATHLSQIPKWGLWILNHDHYDLATSGGRATRILSVADILRTFDDHVQAVRAALVESPEGALAVPWTLRRGSHVLLTMPRIAAMRAFLLHHIIHHRGQMTVYLRLQNVPLPPLYGPTADERM